jgi:hypothetical protein
MQKIDFYFLENSASDEIVRKDFKGEKNINNINFSLHKNGMLPKEAVMTCYKDLTNWQRGGAETYITSFEIHYQLAGNRIVLPIILKAILSMTDVNHRWEQYKNRIKRLNEFGIATPFNYYYQDGVIYQQFIKYSIDEWIEILKTKVDGIVQIKNKIQILLNQITKAGFVPTGLIHNLRIDNDEIYLIDFGSDLGEFKIENKSDNKKLFIEIDNWLINKFK